MNDANNLPHPTRQAVRFRVWGLLGEFDHVVDLPVDNEFAILHGPNGVGKTRFLELIAKVMSGQLPNADSVFDAVEVEYSDGTKIRCRHFEGATLWALDQGSGWREFENSGAEDYVPAVRSLARDGVVRRILPDVFVEPETGDRMSVSEVVERFFDRLDPDLLPVPPVITDFCDSTPSSLIEVNRLRLMEREVEGPRGIRSRERDWVAAPDHYASQLSTFIKEARSNYADSVQKLDRTYPKRLIDAETAPDGVVISELAARVDDLRARLEDTSLVERHDSVEIPAGDLLEWKLIALKLHYEDSLDQLETLSAAADRIGLFLSIVNSKLSRKTMEVDPAKGFYFKSSRGQELLPGQLSSGEQHEVVMTYRLIFEPRDGELVLIDEPEVSLHVGWQRQFLSDLQKIARLTGTRYLVATHSPQIVGTWRDRMVSLGVEEGP